jgi:hypothetical protein
MLMMSGKQSITMQLRVHCHMFARDEAERCRSEADASLSSKRPGPAGPAGCASAARTLKAVSAGHSAGRRSGGTPVVAQRAASTNHLHARTSTQ